jgi:hypothetical protein
MHASITFTNAIYMHKRTKKESSTSRTLSPPRSMIMVVFYTVRGDVQLQL